MKYLKQKEYSILAAMTFSLIRTFVHSLISEQNRYSRIYQAVFKRRLDYIDNLETWICAASMMILLVPLIYKLVNKEWKDAGVLLLFSLLLIPWVFNTYCIK